MTDKLQPITVRHAIDDDRQACAQIFESAWNIALPSKPRQVTVDDLIAQTDDELIKVASRNGTILGFISLWEPAWFIHHLYIDPDFHGIGIGTALVNHASNLANGHQLSLKCQIENIGAFTFYRTLGFIEADEHGEDEYGAWVRLVEKIESGHNGNRF